MKLISSILLATLVQLGSTRVVDQRCRERQCLLLVIENSHVFGKYTGTPSPARLDMGNYDSRGAALIPSTEAPIQYWKSQRGWVAVVSLFVPMEYDLWPASRLYIFNPNQMRTVQDLYYGQVTGFRMGNIFNTESELLVVSTAGEHSYAVNTLVWLLPPNRVAAPRLLLDVQGSLDHVQQSAVGQRPGLWIRRETYNGIGAETKGKKMEFWTWDEDHETLIVSASNSPD